MSFESQAQLSIHTLVGAYNNPQFAEEFLSQHFQEVELDKGEPQPGDLFLFKLRSPKAQSSGILVGVYCGHDEIITFQGRNSRGGGKQKLQKYCQGVVCKQGYPAMLGYLQPLCVLRRHGGIDTKKLEMDVQKAMNSDPDRYHPIHNNCMHFALNLLGVDSNSKYMDLTTD